mgnify:CR=1 FL=1
MWIQVFVVMAFSENIWPGPWHLYGALPRWKNATALRAAMPRRRVTIHWLQAHRGRFHLVFHFLFCVLYCMFLVLSDLRSLFSSHDSSPMLIVFRSHYCYQCLFCGLLIQTPTRMPRHLTPVPPPRSHSISSREFCHVNGANILLIINIETTLITLKNDRWDPPPLPLITKLGIGNPDIVITTLQIV